MTTVTIESAEKTLAQSDYRLITDLATAVERVQQGKRDVAEATLRTVAAYAATLAEDARKAEMVEQLGSATGVDQRHPSAWAYAAQGDVLKATELMVDEMRAARGL